MRNAVNGITLNFLSAEPTWQRKKGDMKTHRKRIRGRWKQLQEIVTDRKDWCELTYVQWENKRQKKDVKMFRDCVYFTVCLHGCLCL